MMIEAILIDDEEMALDVMEILLREIGGVSVTGRFQQVAEAIREAPSLRPDLIFLDIEMPGLNGLSAAEAFKSVCPEAEIIFVTAHTQYAIDAFDRQALGYLLKPVDEERLARVLERYAGLHRKKEGYRGQPEGGDSAQQEGTGATAGRLRLQMLGSLELYTAGGRLLTWRTRKTKELFAYLCHCRGQPIYRYHIIEELWPDHLPGRAQTLFHTSLYNLRTMLKAEGYPDIVSHGDERYWLDTSIMDIDIDRLEAILAGKSGGENPGTAISLYRGDYLETEHYGWAAPRRYELRFNYTSFLKQAAESGSGDGKVRILRKLAELEPLLGGHHERLIGYLEQMGDHAGAGLAREWKERVLGEADE